MYLPIKIYISISLLYKKPLFDAWSTINMCYLDISNSDTDRIWYINFTTCSSNFETKVSILIYNFFYKTLFLIMAPKRKT